MKWISLVFLLAFPLSLLADEQSGPDLLVARADSSYSAGDHRAALKTYTDLAASHSSPALFYNIGNCHYKLGNKAQAVLWFERAHRLAPGDVDINANLELARAQVVDRVNAAPGITLGGGWSAFRAGTEVDTWTTRSLWCCLATFAFLSVWLFLRGPVFRRIFLGLASALGICTVITIALAAYRTSEVLSTEEAILLSPKVDVRSEPREGAVTVFVLHEGTKVTIQKVEDNWCEVRLASGNVGWMKADALERI